MQIETVICWRKLLWCSLLAAFVHLILIRDLQSGFPYRTLTKWVQGSISQLAFYVNLHRAVIGPSATLTGRWRPDIDLRRMLTGLTLRYRPTAKCFQSEISMHPVQSLKTDSVPFPKKPLHMSYPAHKYMVIRMARCSSVRQLNKIWTRM